MPFSVRSLREPPVLLLGLSALLALLLGFVLIPADTALLTMTYGGYWMMLVLVGLWGVSLWRLGRPDLRALGGRLRTAPGAVAWLLACWGLLLVHEPFGFKILMDEAMLAGTAMSMHFEKICIVPMRGHDIQGAFAILGGELDKRPLFHPFLVSLLHDFTGYRPENGFVLNAGLSLGLLVLAYRAALPWGGRPAAMLVTGLLTSLPLLAQNATGAGFEVLNLVMILVVFLLGRRYAERRDEVSVDALVLATVLLAHTRYESVLFVFPVALLILWGWWREGRIVLGWATTISPLLLVPYALHNQVFSVREASWEMGSLEGYDTPFALSYMPDNIAHALAFFFNTTGEQSNSLILSALGLLALVFGVLWLVKLPRRLSGDVSPGEVAWAALALGFWAHTALMMVYFWGHFDDPVIRRLSLPLNLFMALSVAMVAAELPGGRRKWWALGGLLLMGYFGYSLPSMARHDYSLDYYVGRETAWRREFIAAHPERDYLVIDPNSIEWVIHQVSATPTLRAVNDPDVLRFNWRNQVFRDIYVFQRYQIDPATGEMILPEEFDVGSAYELEPVWERRFTPFTLSRISRVTALHEGESVVASGPVPAIDQMTAEEREAAREAYLEAFVQKLP